MRLGRGLRRPLGINGSAEQAWFNTAPSMVPGGGIDLWVRLEDPIFGLQLSDRGEDDHPETRRVFLGCDQVISGNRHGVFGGALFGHVA